MLGDPLAGGEHGDEGLVQTAWGAGVEVLQGGGLAQLGLTQAQCQAAVGALGELAVGEQSPGQNLAVGALWNPDHPHYEFEAIHASARTLGLRIQPLQVRRSDDFGNAFSTAIKSRVEGLVVVPTRLTWLHRQEIADFGLANRIPTVSGWAEFADAGGLLTYGPNVDDLIRRAAVYADRILKGAKPGDLPVEQPTKFELVINLKTAKAIGVTVPEAMLSRADRLIR
jgi:putative ABC transport system substrate-binding protein